MTKIDTERQKTEEKVRRLTLEDKIQTTHTKLILIDDGNLTTGDKRRNIDN